MIQRANTRAHRGPRPPVEAASVPQTRKARDTRAHAVQLDGEAKTAKNPSRVGGGVTLIIAVLCLAGYLGGGVALGVRKNGAALGLAAHPHRARWAELAGLCRDGIRFTQQKLRGSSYAGSNRRGATEPLAAAGRAQPSNHRQNKSKDKGKDKEGESKSRSKSKSKSKSKGDTRHRQEMEYSPPSDSSVAAHDANGDRTEPRKAQLSEQHIVAKNLHQSQAKIAVMGLNEM